MGILAGKKILITGVLTEASIAFSAARLAQEQGAEVLLSSFGRMLPIVRSLVSIPAGLVKMGLAKFYFFSTAGIFIWNTLWITIGLNLGENWQAAEDAAQLS